MDDSETAIPVSETVRRFVARLVPEPVCDGCIAERLSLPSPAAVLPATTELAGSPGFQRSRAPCSLCGSEGVVIRKL